MDSRKWIFLSLALISFLFVYFLSSVIAPFLTAGVLAYLTDPLVTRLHKWKLPRWLGVAIVFLILLIIFALVILLFVPLLERQIATFIAKIPDLITWIQGTVIPWLHDKFGVPADVEVKDILVSVEQHWQKAGGVAKNLFKTVTSSGMAVIELAINIVLIPVVMFYLLRDWDKLVAGIHDLIPRKVEPTLVALLKECDEVLSAFLRGQLMVMIGLGFLYSFGLSIVGLDLAVLIGMISGMVSIVPYLGFIVGVGSASIAAFVQFQDFIHIFYVIVVFSIAQSIEGMVLTPLFVGDKIGLHPVAVIFAVLAGGQLFGFVGILLALPVAAVIMVFLRFLRHRYVSSTLYQEQQQEGKPGG